MADEILIPDENEEQPIEQVRQTTGYLSLILPKADEWYDIGDMNHNSERIDEFLRNLALIVGLSKTNPTTADINAIKVDKKIQDAIDNLINTTGDPDVIDTIKDLVNWIGTEIQKGTSDTAILAQIGEWAINYPNESISVHAQAIDTQIASISDSISELQTDVSGLNSDLSELQTDVSTISNGAVSIYDHTYQEAASEPVKIDFPSIIGKLVYLDSDASSLFVLSSDPDYYEQESHTTESGYSGDSDMTYRIAIFPIVEGVYKVDEYYSNSYISEIDFIKNNNYEILQQVAKHEHVIENIDDRIGDKIDSFTLNRTHEADDALDIWSAIKTIDNKVGKAESESDDDLYTKVNSISTNLESENIRATNNLYCPIYSFITLEPDNFGCINTNELSNDSALYYIREGASWDNINNIMIHNHDLNNGGGFYIFDDATDQITTIIAGKFYYINILVPEHNSGDQYTNDIDNIYNMYGLNGPDEGEDWDGAGVVTIREVTTGNIINNVGDKILELEKRIIELEAIINNQ